MSPIEEGEARTTPPRQSEPAALPRLGRILDVPSSPGLSALENRLDAICPTTRISCDGRPSVRCACNDGEALACGGDMPLQAMVEGAFTRPGVRELALAFHACQEDLGRFGMISFFQLGPSRPEVWGIAPNGCDAVATYRRPDGRDLLLCRARGRRHPLPVDYDLVDVVLMGNDEEPEHHRRLAILFDELGHQCATPSPQPTRRLARARLEAARLVDAEGAAGAELVLEVTVHHGTLEPQVKEACARGEPGAALALRSLTLVYQFDGTSLRATAETAEALSWLEGRFATLDF